MPRKEQLIEKFKVCRGPFPYREFVRLLASLGYIDKSKASGSGRKFVHEDTKHILKFHEPHPGNEIKYYLVKQVRDKLEERGLL